MQCTNSPARWDECPWYGHIFIIVSNKTHRRVWEIEQFEVDSKSQTAIDVCIKTPYIVIFTGSLNK